MYNNGNTSKNVTGASVVDGSLASADFADDGLSGDKIDGGTISNFTSTGIDDNATSEKIDITDSIVDVLTGANLRAVDGILFGSDTAAANALDDYEEGTWTPTQGSFSTWTSPTFTATYTKIGRVVHLNLRQTGGTVGWTAGQAMAGIPYVAGGSVGSIGYASDSGPTSDNGPFMVWSNGNIYFQKAGSESALVFTVTYYI